MSAWAIEPEPVPLVWDNAGRLMVTGTRVPLDTLVIVFERGDSPETIHQSYPSVPLGDIYAIFAYCLRHRDEIDAYMTRRATQLADLRDRVEARFPVDGLRTRLLAHTGA